MITIHKEYIEIKLQDTNNGIYTHQLHKNFKLLQVSRSINVQGMFDC